MRWGRRQRVEGGPPERGRFGRRRLDAAAAAGAAVEKVATSTLQVDIDVPDVPERVVEEVMERVGWVLQSTIRETDVLYRHGDGSFRILLPATEGEQAVLAHRRLEQRLARATLPAYAPVRVRLLDDVSYA
jgi:hypothetical protein